MKILKSILFKISGKVSKEKATALVVALLTALQSLDLIHLTVEDITTIAGVIASLWMLFSRSSRDAETAKVVEAVQTSAQDLGQAVASADYAARTAAHAAKETAAAVSGNIALAAAKADRDSPK